MVPWGCLGGPPGPPWGLPGTVRARFETQLKPGRSKSIDTKIREALAGPKNALLYPKNLPKGIQKMTKNLKMVQCG